MILDHKLLNLKDQSKNYRLSTAVAVAMGGCNLEASKAHRVSSDTKPLAFLAAM